jgi:hypothetical protein
MRKTLFIAIGIFFCTCLLYAAESDYYGSVAVNSPDGLGNIDLAFHLDVDDYTGAINPAESYIILEKTILFPKNPAHVSGKDVGPMVSGGQLTPSSFQVETVNFTGMVSGREVIRKITLTGAADEGQNMLSGTYTEVISGYLPNPIVVSGVFALARPVAILPAEITSNLAGVLKILQVCAGVSVSIDAAFDKNGDGKIGIADAVYVLQHIAGIRP